MLRMVFSDELAQGSNQTQVCERRQAVDGEENCPCSVAAHSDFAKDERRHDERNWGDEQVAQSTGNDIPNDFGTQTGISDCCHWRNPYIFDCLAIHVAHVCSTMCNSD